MLPNQLRHACGFLVVLIAPVLLACAAWTDKPFLVVACVFLVFPLMRVVFGVVPAEGPPPWSERVAGALDRLPLFYCAVLVGSVAVLLLHISRSSMARHAALGWSLSLWVTMAFATCVAHELLHQRSRGKRIVGHLLAGLAGYPVLGYEHARHHQRPGSTAAAEWPRVTESVWQFSGRRLAAVLRESLARRGLAIAGRSGAPAAAGLRIALVATAVTWALFALAAGWTGVSIYAGVIALVAFGLQLITYVQHWGLGDDNIEDAKHGDYGWEGDCQFQAWVTMGLSLHQSHHRNGSRPYYQLTIAADSPRPPAGYLLLILAALLPPLWRLAMAPALAHWRLRPHQPLSAGRRLACVAFYR